MTLKMRTYLWQGCFLTMVAGRIQVQDCARTSLTALGPLSSWAAILSVRSDLVILTDYDCQFHLGARARFGAWRAAYFVLKRDLNTKFWSSHDTSVSALSLNNRLSFLWLFLVVWVLNGARMKTLICRRVSREEIHIWATRAPVIFQCFA